MVDKVKGGVKRGCVHFDTPSSHHLLYFDIMVLFSKQFRLFR